MKKLNFVEHRKAVQKISKPSDEATLRQLLRLLFHQDQFEMYLEKYNAGSKLWRVVNLSERGQYISDFSYPPKPEYCGVGRCNKKGQQAFYASPNLGTCLSEIKNLEIGAQFRAGLWKVKTDFWCLNFTAQRNPTSKSAKVYKSLIGLFDNIGEEHYDQTSVISDWILGEFSEETSTDLEIDGIQGLRYPSTLRTSENEHFTNFVFSKDYVDTSGMELVEWHHLEVSETDDNSCTVTTESIGFRSREGFLADGSLVWSKGPSETGILIPPGGRVRLMWDGQNWIPAQSLDSFESFSPSKTTNW